MRPTFTVWADEALVLGRTGVTVTELGFGGAPIGNLYSALDDQTPVSWSMPAWEGGIRYFDTAPHYGLGLSERRLGAALRERPRDQFAISTKVGRLLVPNPGLRSVRTWRMAASTCPTT